MKKIVAVVSVCLFFSTFLFAHGKGDVAERSVNQDESWRETFDLTDKKEGKYNILVRAVDQGGNESLGGPFNIWIDPESDLPIIGITNPSMNMRIPGNLNIVGTCVDDDAVAKVELIFDGDVEHVAQAQGTEFWSYYLDTNELEEGLHTIEVFGTDINGLRGHSVTVQWHLDRRQPVTQITNYGLGTLVSGKINLKGTVYDGNGIKSLSYSTDNGTTFKGTKLEFDKKTGETTFSVPIDTRELKDGPTVCWFKATDLMGSVGVYSFLYFIDNTPPDVKIVSPERNEVCSGKFGIVGFAKDVMGIQKLTWTLEEETGEFELIPGNPYWYKDINTIGLLTKKGKPATSIDFSVTATDIAGNVVTARRTIPLDQELDKPTLTIEYPPNGGMIDGNADSLFVRGIAFDDDGIATVTYRMDSGNEYTIESQGVFYGALTEGLDLDGGSHTLTAFATDRYGVRGDKVSIAFSIKGKAPVIGGAKLKTATDTMDVVPGMMVNPESDAVLVSDITSECGITSASYEMRWGQDGILPGDIPVPKSGAKSMQAVIPLDSAPWGLVRITISVTDIFDRTIEQTSVLNIKDLTRIESPSPQVLFSDSCVSESGDITLDPDFPVTGYFSGGNAKSVQFVPKTKFATVSLSGNTIILRGTGEQGNSDPVKVRVTTTQGLTYDSRDLIFHSDHPAPVVKINGADYTHPYDGNNTIHLEGMVTSESPISRFGYRILSANANVTSDIVMGVDALPVSYANFTAVKYSKDGHFSVDIDPYNFLRGMYVIEVVAENGKQAADAVFVRKIPPLPARSIDGSKEAVANPPVVTWFDSVDVYYVTTYQGNLNEPVCQRFARDDMKPGVNYLTVGGNYDAKKTYSSSLTVRKEDGVKVAFKSVGEVSYSSGMTFIIPRGAKGRDAPKLVAVIRSEDPVKAVSYEISGEEAPGGDVRQAGKALDIDAVDTNMYEAVIPLENLPARLTKVKVIADTEKGSGSYEGTILVVRQYDASMIDNARKFYWTPQEPVVYNSIDNRYVLPQEAALGGYANVPGPVTATFLSPVPGLDISVSGNVVNVIGMKDGLYRNVALRIKDSQGVEYTSPQIAILVDSDMPEMNIVSPQPQAWVRDSFKLEVSATDGSGIARVEYSFDGGEVWTSIPRSTANANLYSGTVSLAAYEDGLLGLSVRATDNAGKFHTVYSALQKDTVPPEVNVIVPGSEDIVNGDNLIAFSVKDDGYVSLVEYIAPPVGGVAQPAIPVEVAPIVTTHIGTKEKPMHDLMTFNFYDAAGNVTKLQQWDFIIDSQSDLPIAEVHLPEENAVLTKDFTISGVVYDDDGACKIWYKMDNAAYQALPDYGTNFAIDVPISMMTDNEHAITVYAEDMNGVVGPEFVRNFRISLEEPKGTVVTPPITETVKEMVTLHGTATDKNGIKAVYVSVDNGNTYNEATGNFGHDKTDTTWDYTFDTRVIQDGTHAVFIKIIDWFDVEGLFSSLINIDNTKPEINLELPLDGTVTSGMVFFSGQTTDNIELTDLYITVRSLEGKRVDNDIARTQLEVGEIISQPIDLSGLENGFYNIELVGADAANNITRISRNIRLDKTATVARVDVLYPLNGEEVRGVFNIYGMASSEVEIAKLTLYIDGNPAGETELSSSGYFKFQLTPDLISEGAHKIVVEGMMTNAATIRSEERYLNYTSFGPWVTIDNFTYGDFAVDRPYLRGEAGYTISEEELIEARVKGASKELKAAIEGKSVAKVELSLDNGKSFEQISSSGKWRYRIENKDIAEGYHFLLVRATMKNGETAITRTIVQVDNTPPTVKLISPGQGGRYNQTVVFSGLTHDDVELKDVTLLLRKGDKAAYEVPSFIQGLYFDWHFWGATLFDIGVGLTFFDDNVKLQVQWGQFTQTQREMFSGTQGRYGGNSIFGAKILANVYYLPFRFLFGPDWEWLSANVAVGANFSRFNNSDSDKPPMILSAALLQLEFPRITFLKQKLFRTMAFYTEGQLWFIPSDVSGDDIRTIVPQISFGLRVNVF